MRGECHSWNVGRRLVFVCLWISDDGSAELAVGVLLKYSCFIQLYEKVLTKSSWFCSVSLSVCLGSIVSVGDPKKKYTCFEKIGQG